MYNRLEEKVENHENSKFLLSVYKLDLNIESSLPPHYHNNFEILYTKTGEFQITIGSQTYSAKERAIFFSNMYQVHSAVAVKNEPSTLYAIVFDRKILDMVNINTYYIDYIKPFIDGSQRFPECIRKNNKLYNDVKSSIELIIEEYYKKELAYEIFITTAIERLFAAFVRHNEALQNNPLEKLSYSNKQMLDSLLAYFENNYQTAITLDKVSSYLNINKHYFCRLIKRLTGKSFTQFLNMYRIRQAELMLKSTDVPVSQIAEKTGFSNLSYFNRIFLKYSGQTPSKFRR